MMAAPLQTQSADVEVYSEAIRIESKVFYVDLRANVRGRFLKISEKGTNKPRQVVMVPASGLQYLVALLDYYLSRSGAPTSKELAVESKVFHLNVGENHRGRYLRISEHAAGQLSGHNSLVIPCAGPANEGWAAFRDCLARVCAVENVSYSPEAPTGPEPAIAAQIDAGAVVGPGPAPPTLTASRSGALLLKAGPKRFFFDVGLNEKGRFLRISEVLRDERTSIFVPQIAMQTFADAIAACIAADKLQQLPAVAAGLQPVANDNDAP